VSSKGEQNGKKDGKRDKVTGSVTEQEMWNKMC
jgi:hypothetical protein